jgi:hypothetical protein
MINNYTDRCVATGWHNHTHRPRIFARKNRRHSSAGRMLRKSVGVLLVIALLAGVTSSLWLGSQIRTSLGDIGRGREIHAALVTQNRELLAKKNRLLARNHIETVAKDMGLHPPKAGQTRTL